MNINKIKNLFSCQDNYIKDFEKTNKELYIMIQQLIQENNEINIQLIK